MTNFILSLGVAAIQDYSSNRMANGRKGSSTSKLPIEKVPTTTVKSDPSAVASEPITERRQVQSIYDAD